ncbi:hypothetical protein NFX46_18390 [Streptomyces phaeoluteigriseus]|uniref:Uncharacterized protein n=1 Tax=Streptomyces phaeoluteigriseus TaxID=114686 RepID=A0ABY4Z948_9ACTN|nr:hypothetical protein [Streptomyces phaeoluteigriseus]USQ85569.1 hypothetical protein NFX46_18390 [Streptomyces phaeoluteigriseus]
MAASSSTVPATYGSGGIADQAASTLVLAISVPVWCLLCQDSGSRRYCRTACRRDVACSWYCVYARLAEADRDDERHSGRHGGHLSPPSGRTRRHDVGGNVTHDVRHADR